MKFKSSPLILFLGFSTASPLPAADAYAAPSGPAAPGAASPQAAAYGKNPAPIAAEEERTLGASLAVGYETEYYFNGRGIAKDLVFGSLDWSLPLDNTFSLNLGAWYGNSASEDFSNLNLSAGVSANLGPVTVGVRYRWIDIITPPEDTPGNILKHSINEIGLTLDSKAGPVNLNGAAYYDDQTDGFYFEFGGNAPIKITEWLSLVPAAAVGLNSDYYGIDGFSHVRVSLAAPIHLTKTATLTPFIAGNLVFDKLKHVSVPGGEEEEEEEEENYPSEIYGGITLTVKF